MPDKRYFPRDFKNVAACTSGQKYWCESHGIKFREFAKNGLTAKEIRSFKDTYAIKLLEAVINEAKN